MGLAAMDYAWVGASLVLEGIPDLTHLPPSSRLQGPDGVTLVVDMENLPCQEPAVTIEKALPGQGKGFKRAAEGKRGVTAWVEREGVLRLGDEMRCTSRRSAAGRSRPDGGLRRCGKIVKCGENFVSAGVGFVSETRLANLAVFRSQNAFGKCVSPGITSQTAQFAPLGDAHGLQDRHRDCARSEEEADHGDRPKLGIPSEHLLPYGHDKAKVSQEFIKSLAGKPDGKLVLVTAINPTPAGEGKTTTTVGLGDGLNRIGKKAVICIREASLGPNFGMKGGAAGGGMAQVVPMEEMNLHFTGDFHAITSAHNLLSAMIDNHIYWGNELAIDERRIVWRRVMDMNDRALRDIVVNLGGVANGFPRQTGFDITVASEVMAILCLSNDLDDLQKRLGDIVVAYTREKKPIYCRDIKADGAMTVLLKDAMQPNLVQTLENNPAFVHGGPFANIAHGCNSVIATKTALKLGEYVVTEAGFGADLGAEKFFDIKCRKAGLKPSAAVIVATVRAMKMNGGVAKADLGRKTWMP
jgi:hypothetical protein